MIIKADKPKIRYDGEGNMELSVNVLPECQTALKGQYDTLKAIEVLKVELKKYSQKRSLDANGYAWLLMEELANALKTSKDEVYETMLSRYGQIDTDENGNKIVFSVRSDINVKGHFKHVVSFGNSYTNDVKFTHYKVLKGSSEYDTSEMSIFIDGIVSECKELGIDTSTPYEKSVMEEK